LRIKRSFQIECLKCGGIAERTDYINGKDYTYRCRKCGALTGVPTHWAECKLKGILSKDQHFNDCWYCPLYQFYHTEIHRQGKCPHMIRYDIPFEEVWNSEYARRKGLKLIEV